MEKLKEEERGIIFIHGWGLSSKIWAEQINYFSKMNNVVNINLRGHGAEKSAEGPYTVSTFTHDLKQRIERGGIKKPVLVGSSLGGMVVLNFLFSFPGVARAAILVGTSPCFLRKDGFVIGVSETILERLRKQLLKNCEKRMKYFYEQIVSGEESKFRPPLEGSKKNGRVFFEAPSQHVLLDTLKELEKWDVRERLDEIDLPVMIIHGENDGIFSVECARRLAVIRRSRVEVISGACHLPFLRHAKQVNKIIEEFLHSVDV